MAFFLPGVVTLTITTGMGLYYYLRTPATAVDNHPVSKIAVDPIVTAFTNEIKSFDKNNLKPATQRILKPPPPTLEDSLRKVINDINSSLNKRDDV